MATYVYPTSVELTEIAQDLTPRLEADREIFNILPVRSVDSHLLEWEQLDNYIGLQQVRGLGGDPPRVKAIGAKRYQMEPGVYGEFRRIDEVQLTARRQYGTFGTPINITDLVREAQEQLLLRRLDRQELIGWTLLSTGTFSVAGPMGTVLHTDTFTLKTYTAGVTWATSATAVPLANFRAVKLLGRGSSSKFGAGATAYMNQTTFNSLVTNTNANDLAGRRVTGLLSPLNLQEIGTILMGEDLPKIRIYDEGYIDDSGTFQLFIPNNKVIVVGQRPAGQRLGEYRMTRNANNADLAPGPYMKVVDEGERTVPRVIDVHDGHNGGPVLYFPGGFVVMTV